MNCDCFGICDSVYHCWKVYWCLMGTANSTISNLDDVGYDKGMTGLVKSSNT